MFPVSWVVVSWRHSTCPHHRHAVNQLPLAAREHRERGSRLRVYPVWQQLRQRRKHVRKPCQASGRKVFGKHRARAVKQCQSIEINGHPRARPAPATTTCFQCPQFATQRIPRQRGGKDDGEVVVARFIVATVDRCAGPGARTAAWPETIAQQFERKRDVMTWPIVAANAHAGERQLAAVAWRPLPVQPASPVPRSPRSITMPTSRTCFSTPCLVMLSRIHGTSNSRRMVSTMPAPSASIR